MSTDPQKMVKTTVFAYFLGGMFLLAGAQMTFSVLAVGIFCAIALILYISAMFSLWQQYRKYHLPIFLYLIFIGLLLSVLAVGLFISTVM